MSTTCTFQLDRINPIYNSGELIEGKILLKTKKAKRVNAVYVSLEGEAKVQWSITGKETANYFGHQLYLYTRTNVTSTRNFSAGTHVYNISLRIPKNCPSSCIGPYGYVAYHMSLVIDKTHSFNEIFRQPICVVQTLDLNLNPDYAIPVRGENMKYLCHWPCSSGPIYFYLMLPFSGYTPGQQITYLLEIDNQSPHYDVWSVEASLKQHFVFLARKPLKRNYYTKTLNKNLVNEQTLRLSKRLYEGAVMVPPHTPRSTLNTNYIVFLHYTLQIKLKMGYFHYDAVITVPVVIGTTPLQHFLEDQIENAENISSGIVTTQPTLRLYQQLSQILHELPSNQQSISETCQNALNLDDNDNPPSYDSCLPPSFSYATLSSQDTLDDVKSFKSKCYESQLLKIQMPQFPDYNTFTTRSQCLTQSSACSSNYLEPSSDTNASLDTLEYLNENSSNQSVNEDEDCDQEEKEIVIRVKEDSCRTEDEHGD